MKKRRRIKDVNFASTVRDNDGVDSAGGDDQIINEKEKKSYRWLTLIFFFLIFALIKKSEFLRQI